MKISVRIMLASFKYKNKGTFTPTALNILDYILQSAAWKRNLYDNNERWVCHMQWNSSVANNELI